MKNNIILIIEVSYRWWQRVVTKPSKQGLLSVWVSRYKKLRYLKSKYRTSSPSEPGVQGWCWRVPTVPTTRQARAAQALYRLGGPWACHPADSEESSSTLPRQTLQRGPNEIWWRSLATESDGNHSKITTSSKDPSTSLASKSPPTFPSSLPLRASEGPAWRHSEPLPPNTHTCLHATLTHPCMRVWDQSPKAWPGQRVTARVYRCGCRTALDCPVQQCGSGGGDGGVLFPSCRSQAVLAQFLRGMCWRDVLTERGSTQALFFCRFFNKAVWVACEFAVAGLGDWANLTGGRAVASKHLAKSGRSKHFCIEQPIRNALTYFDFTVNINVPWPLSAWQDFNLLHRYVKKITVCVSNLILSNTIYELAVSCAQCMAK